MDKAFSLFSGKGAQQGYWAAADQGLISLTNFVAAIILGRAVEPEEFGIYAVGFLMTRFVRAIQDGLIVQPLNSFGAVLDRRGFQEYATNSGLLQIILAVLSAIAAASLGYLLTVLGNDVAGPTAISPLVYITHLAVTRIYPKNLLYTQRGAKSGYQHWIWRVLFGWGFSGG